MRELVLQARRWVERLREKLGEMRGGPGRSRTGLDAPGGFTQAEWGSGDAEERSVCCRGGETLPTAF